MGSPKPKHVISKIGLCLDVQQKQKGKLIGLGVKTNKDGEYRDINWGSLSL